MSQLGLYRTQMGRLLLRPSDNISSQILAGKFWDEHLQPYFDALTAQSIAVDVGAYLGCHTVYLAKRCRHVYAFEPQVAMFYQLCGNLALNDCRNVTAYNRAVMDYPCLVRAGDYQQPGKHGYDAARNAAALAYIPAGEGDVEAVALDDVIPGPVDLIKVDAQGCDLFVLWGAKRLLETYRPTVLFEYEEDLAAVHGHLWSDYGQFLWALDYEVQRIGRADYVARPAQEV